MSLPPGPSPERRQLAAEYAVGLLTGDELERARAQYRQDVEFASEVARWRARLAPLLDEIEAVTPPAHVGAAIERAIAGATGASGGGGNMVALRRKVKLWRGIAAGAVALAAAFALLLLVPKPVIQQPAAPPAARPAPLVAVLGGEQQPMKLVASWYPADRELILAGAGGLSAEPRHSHELWVIPADGTPRSLGTIPSEEATRIRIDAALARELQSGATLAVSVEPQGGSPTGLPTGPVIASGKLERV